MVDNLQNLGNQHAIDPEYDVSDIYSDLRDSLSRREDVDQLEKSARISTTVGAKGTSAILGFDHNLVQLSSYINKSLALVRGFNQGNERLFLAQVQKENDGTTGFGWGLDLRLSPRRTFHRGFINGQWPVCMCTHGDILRRSSTYVKDGCLVQVMALHGWGDCEFEVSIGGKIQLLRRTFENDDNEFGYDVTTSPNCHILSASCSCEDLTYCVDVELFRNGLRINPDIRNSSPTELAADINWTYKDRIRWQESIVFVARFTLREQSQVLEHAAAPEWEEIKCHLGFGFDPWRLSTAWNLWNEEPGETDVTQLPTQRILPTIVRNVQQLLSVAALPHDNVNEPDAQETYLINNLVEISKLKQDYESCFWHIRLLTNTLLSLKKSESGKVLCGQISDVISGVMRMLFRAQSTDFTSEDAYFRVLSLFYYYKHVQDCPISYLREMFCRENFLSPNLSDDEAMDPIKCLLFWYNCKGFVKLFPLEKLPEAVVEWLDSLKPSSLIGFSRKQKVPGNTYVDRDGRWSRLALLSTELVEDDPDLVEGLVLEVKRQLHERQPTSNLGDLAPWEYYCLNHSLPVDLVLAKADLHMPQATELKNLILKVLDHCSPFLQSDRSFLKSWDMGKYDSIRERWDFDCSSIVSTTILRLAAKLKNGDCITNGRDPNHLILSTPCNRKFVANRLLIQKSGKNSQSTLVLKTRLDRISRILHDISHSIKNEERFRWQEGLRVDALYYPQFMQIFPGSPEFCKSIDHKRLFNSLRQRNRHNSTIVKFIKEDDQEKYFPTEWTLQDLNIWLTEASTTIALMGIRDFPPGDAAGSDVDVPGGVSQLLRHSRVDRNARYRIIKVERFSPALFSVYTHAAHPEAWDAVIDYFGSSSILHRVPEGRDTYDAEGDATWNFAITISHFVLEIGPRPGCVRDAQDFSPELGPQSERTRRRQMRFLLPVCTSICMTGDKLGEFWTCSVLGATGLHQAEDEDQQGSGDKIEHILNMYAYDKSSARHLVCIVLLTEICEAVAREYRDILKELDDLMKLPLPKELHNYINAEKTPEATSILQRAHWGIGWLNEFRDSLKSSLHVINEAAGDMQASLSDRRNIWEEKLKKFEGKEIWREYQSRSAKLQDCEDQIVDATRKATRVRDDLLSLSHLATSQASLKVSNAQVNLSDGLARLSAKTAEDGTTMKIIAILTALFLPGTFMAILLTTPMFKWPDPPDGKIIVRLPFELYWAVSGSVTIVLGAGMLAWFLAAKWHADRPNN